MKKLQVIADKDDNIPMSSIVRQAGGEQALKAMGESTSESTLLRAARTVQRLNREKAPPESIDTKSIKSWAAKHSSGKD